MCFQRWERFAAIVAVIDLYSIVFLVGIVPGIISYNEINIQLIKL
jgi:hypothetical protein